MNPFDFVPLRKDGPKPLPEEILNDHELYEGYIEYSIETLTPLHITNKIASSNDHARLSNKSFNRERVGGPPLIPGSAIRGMLLNFIETLTGSDLSVITEGDEKNFPYGKNFTGNWRDNIENRHVGFKVQSGDHPNGKNLDPISYMHNSRIVNRSRFECTPTLPSNYGLRKQIDAATFLFGKVKDNNSIAGRLVFEDILLNDNMLADYEALDIIGDSVFGSPNPRANTAWYFLPRIDKTTPSPRIRHTNYGDVWEVLAHRVRGRKFYYHQDPIACIDYYWRKWAKVNGGFSPLCKYRVQSIIENRVLPNGKLFFKSLPLKMVMLLRFAMELEPGMAHKLGALRPFGFGSIRIKNLTTCLRKQVSVFEKYQEEKSDVKIDEFASILDKVALEWLRKISSCQMDMENQNSDNLFIYPPFDMQAKGELRGFAQIETAIDNLLQPNPNSNPRNYKKLTLFFDSYQRGAINFPVVMAGFDKLYHHRPY